MPVTIPRTAAGITTVATVLHLLVPKAKAPSRNMSGTARRDSSVVRTAMGIIITPSAIPPAKVEKCFMGSTMMV